MSLLGPNGEPADQAPEPSPETEAVPAPPTRVVTAFLVFQMPNGQWISSEDIGTPIIPVRPPVADDLIAGAENVKAQVIARKTADLSAVATVRTQMSVAQQMQQQQASPTEAAVLAQIARGR